METPGVIRNMPKQWLWITPGQELVVEGGQELVVEGHLTKDFRSMSLVRQQWPVVSRVLIIHLAMQLPTMKAGRNLRERA